MLFTQLHPFAIMERVAMQSIYSQFYDSRSPFVPEVYKKWASTEPSYMSEASDHSEDENVVVVKKLPWRSLVR